MHQTENLICLFSIFKPCADLYMFLDTVNKQDHKINKFDSSFQSLKAVLHISQTYKNCNIYVYLRYFSNTVQLLC